MPVATSRTRVAGARLDPARRGSGASGVLAEGEQPRVAVVGRAERREQPEPPARREEIAATPESKLPVSLGGVLERVAVAAAAHVRPGEKLSGVIPTEPTEGERVYLCAFVGAEDSRAWLALDQVGGVIAERRLVRDAVAIAALCEAAEEALASGREEALNAPPRLATPSYLDDLGAAARELDRANGLDSGLQFARGRCAPPPQQRRSSSWKWSVATRCL